MSVVGDEIIENCRACFSQNGFGVRLARRSGLLVCSYNPSHQYVVEKGFLKRVDGVGKKTY